MKKNNSCSNTELKPNLTPCNNNTRSASSHYIDALNYSAIKDFITLHLARIEKGKKEPYRIKEFKEVTNFTDKQLKELLSSLSCSFDSMYSIFLATGEIITPEQSVLVRQIGVEPFMQLKRISNK